MYYKEAIFFSEHFKPISNHLEPSPIQGKLLEKVLVNCGNEKYRYSCKLCHGTGKPSSWCSQDCEWSNFWKECRKKGENEYVGFISTH